MGLEEKGYKSGGGYTLCKSACEHCFSAPARAASMKVLSLHRHAKSLAWQPVEPIAERAGLCWGRRKYGVSLGLLLVVRMAWGEWRVEVVGLWGW